MRLVRWTLIFVAFVFALTALPETTCASTARSSVSADTSHHVHGRRRKRKKKTRRHRRSPKRAKRDGGLEF